MVKNHQSGKPSAPTLTPERAVSIGQLIVNLPVISIMALGGLLAYVLKGSVWTAFGIFLGIIPAWLWWSFMIPSWREWAKNHGADEEQTQYLGQRCGLVWPKGSIFEKTE